MDEVLVQVDKVNEFLSTIIGIEPVLILAVIVIVSLIARLFKLRTRMEDHDNFEVAMVILCFVVSGCVAAFVVEVESVKQVVRNAIVLGSVSAILYKVIKRAIVGGLKFIQKHIEGKTNIEFDDDDNNILW